MRKSFEPRRREAREGTTRVFVTTHDPCETSILSGVPRVFCGTQSKDAGHAREPHPSTARQNNTAAPLRMLACEGLRIFLSGLRAFAVKKGFTIFVVLCLLSPAMLVAAQQPNLLTNPGFESPYAQQCCHTEQGFDPNTPYAEVQVANGWTAYWIQPDSSAAFPSYCDYNIAPITCQPYHRPEFRDLATAPERIHSGANAQKYFTFYSTHLAGLYQQVTGAIPGRPIASPFTCKPGQPTAVCRARRLRAINSWEYRLALIPTAALIRSAPTSSGAKRSTRLMYGNRRAWTRSPQVRPSRCSPARCRAWLCGTLIFTWTTPA